MDQVYMYIYMKMYMYINSKADFYRGRVVRHMYTALIFDNHFL